MTRVLTTIWDRHAPFVAFASQTWPQKDQLRVTGELVRWRQTLLFHLLFFRGQDLSPESANAFDFEQGVEVSPKLPGLC